MRSEIPTPLQALRALRFQLNKSMPVSSSSERVWVCWIPKAKESNLDMHAIVALEHEQEWSSYIDSTVPFSITRLTFDMKGKLANESLPPQQNSRRCGFPLHKS